MPSDTSSDDHPYRVHGNRRATPVIREQRLAPQAAVPPYRPRQYVWFIDHDYQVPPRPNSMANAAVIPAAKCSLRSSSKPFTMPRSRRHHHYTAVSGPPGPTPAVIRAS